MRSIRVPTGIALFLVLGAAAASLVLILTRRDRPAADRRPPPRSEAHPKGIDPTADYDNEDEDRVLELESDLRTLAARIRHMSAAGAARMFEEGYRGGGLLSSIPAVAVERAADGVRILAWDREAPTQVDPAASLKRFFRPLRSIESCRFFVLRCRTREGKTEGTLEIEVEAATEKGERLHVRERHDFEAQRTGKEWRISRLTRIAGRRLTGAGRGFRDVTEELDIRVPVFPERRDRMVFHEPYSLLGGIAVGDHDGDGDLDIFLPRVGRDLLLRNDGDRFTDVTRAAGLGSTAFGAAALFVDYDGDGDLDLLVTNFEPALVPPARRTGHGGLVPNREGRALILYRNEGNGTFTDVTEAAGLKTHGPATSVAAADVDGDGDLDLYVCMYKGFREADQERLYPIPSEVFDARDGEPNQLWINEGGRFREEGARRGVADRGWGLAAGFCDYDDDGDPDLYVANDYGRNRLYRNRGDGTFEDVTTQAGADDLGFGMGVAWGDYDGDGRFDLYVSNMHSVAGERILARAKDRPARAKLRKMARGNTLLRNRGDGTFEDVSEAAAVAQAGWAWGPAFLDFDNDGELDLYVANGYITGETDLDIDSPFWRMVRASALHPGSREIHAPALIYRRFRWHLVGLLKAGENAPEVVNAKARILREAREWLQQVPALSFSGDQRNRLFRNLGKGAFAEVGSVLGATPRADGRGFVAADLDRDGDLDLVIRNYYRGPLVVLRNDTEPRRASLTVRLRGVRSNRFGVGARITAAVGRRTQVREITCGGGYSSGNPAEVSFGLGGAERVDRLTIRWPSGGVQVFRNVSGGAVVTITEAKKEIDRREYRPRVAARSVEKPRTLRAGDRVSLPDAAGRILFFFRTDCAVCEEDIRGWPDLRARHPGAARRMRWLSLDSAGQDEVRSRLRSRGVAAPFRVVSGAERRSLFGPSDPPLPICLVVGKDGRIREKHVGRGALRAAMEVRLP